MSVDEAVSAILAEHQRATALHPPFNSAHEGYAVLQEEIEEAWQEIKHGTPTHAQKEMTQVGAMVLRFLTECGP